MKPSLLLFVALGSLTAGCSAAPTPAPKVLLAQADTSKIAQVKAGTLKTANASWWGFDKDDATDCLQNAINSGVPKLIVDNTGSDWIINKPLTLVSNQEIDFADIERQRLLVQGAGDLVALEHAAIDEELALRVFDPVAGTRHGAGGAVEVQGDGQARSP